MKKIVSQVCAIFILTLIREYLRMILQVCILAVGFSSIFLQFISYML